MTYPHTTKSTNKSTKHLTRMAQLALPLAISLATNAQALSLDEAVELQIATPIGGLACTNLIDAGADLTGELANTICFSNTPQGGSIASTGGGSATPASMPGSGFSGDAESITSDSGNWSMFFTVENESLDRDASETESAFDSSLNSFVIGASYMPTVTSAYSLVLDVTQHDGDYEGGGDFALDTTGLHFLASFQTTDQFSIDVAATYEDVSAERQRNTNFTQLAANGGLLLSIDGTPDADYDYDQMGLALRGIYDFNAGSLNIATQFGFDWLNSDYGTYSEQGASGLELTFHDDEKKSLQAVLGIQGSYSMDTSFGAFIPQIDLTWRHEFKDDERDVNVSFVQDLNSIQFSYQTDELDSDFAELSLGGVFVFKNGTQAFITVQTLLAHEDYDSFMASAGLRIEL